MWARNKTLRVEKTIYQLPVNVQFTWPLRVENLAMAEENNGADLEEATKFDAFICIYIDLSSSCN